MIIHPLWNFVKNIISIFWLSLSLRYVISPHLYHQNNKKESLLFAYSAQTTAREELCNVSRIRGAEKDVKKGYIKGGWQQRHNNNNTFSSLLALYICQHIFFGFSSLNRYGKFSLGFPFFLPFLIRKIYNIFHYFFRVRCRFSARCIRVGE